MIGARLCGESESVFSNAVRCSLLSILQTQKSPATLYDEKARLIWKDVFRYFDLWSKIYRLIFSA